jgi:hypothetical protein
LKGRYQLDPTRINKHTCDGSDIFDMYPVRLLTSIIFPPHRLPLTYREIGGVLVLRSLYSIRFTQKIQLIHGYS